LWRDGTTIRPLADAVAIGVKADIQPQVRETTLLTDTVEKGLALIGEQ
jgi:hypothetical protein